MSFSYDSTLAANLDWVRFYTQDNDSTDYELEDEEITAIIAEEVARGATVAGSVKHFATASAFEALLAKWSSGGRDIESKTVGKLKITYGSGDIQETIQARIDYHRKRGAWLLTPGSKMFSVLGWTTRTDGWRGR